MRAGMHGRQPLQAMGILRAGSSLHGRRMHQGHGLPGELRMLVIHRRALRAQTM
jgi:hypothetical protein